MWTAEKEMNMGEFKSRTSLNFFRASFSLLLNCYSLLRRSLSYSYIDIVVAAIGFWNFLLLPAEVTGSRISPDNGIIAKTCLQNLDFTATPKEPHLFLQRLYLMLSGCLVDSRFRLLLSEFLAKPISESIFSVVSSIGRLDLDSGGFPPVGLQMGSASHWPFCV